MNGDIKFEDALKERLAIIQPTIQDIERCISDHPLVLTPNITTLISNLRSRKVDVFLITGGFLQLIQPLLSVLQIPRDHVYSNVLKFTEDGKYGGFDEFQPTSRSGGKAKAVAAIIQKYGFRKVVMVGDGVTDMEARPPASLFIGFGGIVTREKVKQGADHFVTDFSQLILTEGPRFNT
eukprot:TRINITY_DN3448_c0_g1_i2.p1 TRINITY_DN3448_c0_g1~~TRINITY_DN3448_c0_g1_i2.p1  ORF type:complete len:179 (+),score=37.62 TRINITY_DN3448_c0_g1_i2:274-810(+)